MYKHLDSRVLAHIVCFGELVEASLSVVWFAELVETGLWAVWAE